jgi:hypothetical protein
MQYDRMLAELFGEEDRAREMAAKLADIARTSPEAAAAERESLLAFLRGPIERHFAFEEQAIFPKLVEHDLGPEVQVACKQHDTVRQLAAKLAAWEPGSATRDHEEPPPGHEGEHPHAPGAESDLGALVFDIARQLLHHTNFEGDYIYPELTHEEWRELMKRTVEEQGAASEHTPKPAGHEGGSAPKATEGSVPAESSVNS